jgi:ElaB/YqjD/DUF883 family membrane-anchored ribosome-binding protein
MTKQTQAISDELNTLAEDAHSFLAAPADVRGEKVGETRKRLAAALERGKKIYSSARDKVVDRAKAADETVRDHPYQAIAIAVGIGTILGFLIGYQCSRNRD